jgi:uncharacterized protein (DUF1330 family)
MAEKTVMIVRATVNPVEISAFEHYTKNAGPLFKKAGGTPVAKYQLAERVVGTADGQFLVIMEFPNKEAIRSVFESAEYKALLPARDKGYLSLNVFIGEQ